MQDSTLPTGYGRTVSAYLVVTLLVCYPTLAVALQGAMNAVFFLMVACSAYLLYLDRLAGEKPDLGRSTQVYSLAMLLPTVAVLANQVSLGTIEPREFDGPARFLLAPVLYLALVNTRVNLAAALELAFPVGAISAFLTATLTPPVWGRAVSYFLDAIHFGDFALLFGFLSLFSINWYRLDSRWMLGLKLLGSIAGIYTSILSGTRGGWLAIPVLAALWLFWVNRERGKLYRYLTLVTVLIACVASYFLSGMVQQRVDRAIANLHSYAAGGVDSGTAARLELWKASYYMFTQRPWFGVGTEGFKQMLTTMHEQGRIAELVMVEGKMEAHSEIAANLARYGAVGLVAILMLYLVPIWNFAKFLRSKNGLSAGAARMGICVAVSFLVFGLTVETFNLKVVAAFYSFTIAVLLAVAANRHAIAE